MTLYFCQVNNADTQKKGAGALKKLSAASDQRSGSKKKTDPCTVFSCSPLACPPPERNPFVQIAPSLKGSLFPWDSRATGHGSLAIASFPYVLYVPSPIPFLFCPFPKSYRNTPGGTPRKPFQPGIPSKMPIPSESAARESKYVSARLPAGASAKVGLPARHSPHVTRHCIYLLCYAAVHSPAPSAPRAGLALSDAQGLALSEAEGSHPRKHRKSFMERCCQP